MAFSQTNLNTSGCNTIPVLTAINTFEGGTQSLAATGTFTKVSGNSKGNGSLPNNLPGGNGNGGLRIYGKGGDNETHPLYTSAQTSWYTRGTTTAVTFGSVNVINRTNRVITFNLAAFGTTTGTIFGAADLVKLEVRIPGSTEYSSEIIVTGNGATGDGSRFDFASGSTFTETYDGNKIPTTIAGTYNVIKLQLPDNVNFNNLDFRITATSTDDTKLWLIDDVKVTDGASPVTKTYSAGVWKNANGTTGIAPTFYEKAIIEGAFTGSFTACECEVKTTGSVTIPSNDIVTLNSKLVNNGIFTVESDGNFIQIDNAAVNTGNIVVKRNSSMQKNDYTYWSSPVAGQELKGFSPKTSATRFYKYDEPTNLFVTVPSAGVNFVPGRGYAIMAPSDYTTTLQTFEGKFTGVANNGVITSPVTFSGSANQGYNLVGNPYPSNIDFEKLHSLNSGTIPLIAYFWRNTDRNRKGSTNGNTDYRGNGYAMYNGTGGNPETNGGAAPTQFIKVGQGFIVKAGITKDLIFNNTVRNGKDTSIFFSKNAASDKDRFWLTLTSPSNNVNTVLIGYVPNATNEFELGYDAPLLAIGSDSFYTILGDEKLGIQGKSYPLTKEDVVALGTKHFESGKYTISLGNKEGIFATGQNIYLKDKETKITTNLSEGDYTFNVNAGEFSNRFEIVYSASAALGVGVDAKAGTQLYREGQDFVGRSAKKITGFELFDMSGRMIMNQKTNAKEIRFSAAGLLSGTYILNAQLEGGERFSKKLIK